MSEKNTNIIKVLFIGDIVGKPGIEKVNREVPILKKEYNLDLVVANGENAADGIGITSKELSQLQANIDIITSGNHIWDKKEIIEIIDKEPYLLRPANYPEGTPGRSSAFFEVNYRHKVGIINLSGTVFMPVLASPFVIIQKLIEKLKEEGCLCIIIDFHAEATSEKLALAHFVDGKVSAVLGTHTHVQTADEKILTEGTAYITDVGMTGPKDSIIGVKKELVLKRFLTQMPVKLAVAEGNSMLNGVVLELDSKDGRALKISRINI